VEVPAVAAAGAWRRGLPYALALVALIAMTCVLLTYRWRPDLAVQTGCLFSGAVAVTSGCLVLLRARTRPRGARPALLLIGAAMAIWGVGQWLVALSMALGVSTFPTAGDVVATAAAPFGIAGLLMALRGGSRYAGSARFALDSLLLGSCVALVVWRACFGRVLFQQGIAFADVTAVLVLLTEVTLLALLLLAYLRDLDRNVLLTVVGMALYCGADLTSVYTLVQPGGQWPPVAAAMWCLAWPCVAVGMAAYTPTVRRDDDWYDSDTRVTMTTVVLSVAALAVFLLLMMASPQVDRGTMWIGLLVVAVFGAREVVSGRQRGRLLATLTDHAVHDPLTELMNRRGLLPYLRQAARSGEASLLTLDLDGFKEVNDLLGHSQGDSLLVAVSRRLELAAPPGAAVFRIGGDEFAIVVPGGSERAETTSQDLLHAVRAAAQDVPGAHAVGVSASIGVARLSAAEPAAERTSLASARPARRPVPESSSDTLSVLVQSGAALGAAKRAGRDRVEYYDGQVAAHHRRQLLIERRLHDAVARGVIAVHYQPVLDLHTRRVVGLEALARWTDPVLGRVGPDEFIPLAERSGLIDALGAHVLRRALGDFTASRPELVGLNLAVNVSPIQLRQADFGPRLMRLVKARGLDPQRLVIEVTESTFVDGDDVGLDHLAMVRREGANVAIDDFGSGFSALAYLSRLPANIIKVDQSLTAMVVGDPRSQAVLATIADLGARLAVDVVVEGIETEAVHDVVLATGAAFGQGWLYSAAVPVDRLSEAIARINATAHLSTGAAPVAGEVVTA
jgi:diguanylate cyclase (GGDEF)-like protein